MPRSIRIEGDLIPTHIDLLFSGMCDSVVPAFDFDCGWTG